MKKVLLKMTRIELNVPLFKACKLKSCPYDALLHFFSLSDPAGVVPFPH